MANDPHDGHGKLEFHEAGTTDDRPRAASTPDPSYDEEGFVRFFSRHLVSLGCLYERMIDGEWVEKKFFVSAFVFSLREVWHLATAGHVIEQIEEFLADPSKRNERFVLLDGFAPGARHDQLVPFDYKHALRWKIHDESGGADFGVIVIDPNTQMLLEANCVVPVAEANWKLQKERDYLTYMLVGLPSELMELERPEVAAVSPYILNLGKIEEVPEPLRGQTYPMFYGRIRGELPLRSIQGMSGSPILGFVQNDEGRLVYYVVAVQSGWLLPGKEVVYATKFKYLAERFEDLIEAELTRAGQKLGSAALDPDQNDVAAQ